jgi:hypothetical protein
MTKRKRIRLKSTGSSRPEKDRHVAPQYLCGALEDSILTSLMFFGPCQVHCDGPHSFLRLLSDTTNRSVRSGFVTVIARFAVAQFPASILRRTSLTSLVNQEYCGDVVLVQNAPAVSLRTKYFVALSNQLGRQNYSREVAVGREYLAADEREDAEAVQAALQAFLADGLSGGHLHQLLQ